MFTVGHSNRSIEEFLSLLTAHGIQVLVDVRRLPGSNRYPQFNADELEKSLRSAGIKYRYFPDLGGRRSSRKAESKNLGWRVAAFRAYADYMETAPFKRSFERLLKLAHKKRVAVMCAEALPWRCHRRLIADAALAGGVETFDIMTPKRAVADVLPAWAKVRRGRLSYPGDQAA